MSAHIVVGMMPECEHIKSINGEVLPTRPLTDAKAIFVAPDSTIYIAETNSKRLNQVLQISFYLNFYYIYITFIYIFYLSIYRLKFSDSKR